MTVRYHTRADSTIVPDYVCQNDGISNAAPICQHLPGAAVGHSRRRPAAGHLTPLALEVALTVTDELAAQAGHADALRAAHVQRAQHAADQARRRYLAVDPGNRLVADALEADWNARLRELATAHDDYTTARPPPPSWTTSSAPASGHWPPISPRSGTTRPPRCGSASA